MSSVTHPEHDVKTLMLGNNKKRYIQTSAEDQPKVKKTTVIKNVLINKNYRSSSSQLAHTHLDESDFNEICE